MGPRGQDRLSGAMFVNAGKSYFRLNLLATDTLRNLAAACDHLAA